MVTIVYHGTQPWLQILEYSLGPIFPLSCRACANIFTVSQYLFLCSKKLVLYHLHYLGLLHT